MKRGTKLFLAHLNSFRLHSIELKKAPRILPPDLGLRALAQFHTVAPLTNLIVILIRIINAPHHPVLAANPQRLGESALAYDSSSYDPEIPELILLHPHLTFVFLRLEVSDAMVDAVERERDAFSAMAQQDPQAWTSIEQSRHHEPDRVHGRFDTDKFTARLPRLRLWDLAWGRSQRHETALRAGRPCRCCGFRR